MPTAHDAIIWLSYDVMCFVLLPRLLYTQKKKKNLVELAKRLPRNMHACGINTVVY